MPPRVLAWFSGSPLASRRHSRCCPVVAGRPGWSDDFRMPASIWAEARRSADDDSAFIPRPDLRVEIAHECSADDTVDVIDEVAETVAKTSNDNALMLTEYGLGMHWYTATTRSERQRGGADLLLRTHSEMLKKPLIVAPTEVWVGRTDPVR